MSQAWTPPEIPEPIQRRWQDVIDLLASLIAVPAALIMRVVDADIEVFLASHSDGNPYRPGAKEHLEGSGLYCETVIRTRRQLLVPDALADPAWRNNPDVPLGMISYLGLPLVFPNGRPFGTICILDRRENAYSDQYEKLLNYMREIIESQLALVYANHALGEENRRLADLVEEIEQLRGIIPICASCKKIRDSEGYWESVEHYIERHTQARFTHGLCADCTKKLYGDI